MLTEKEIATIFANVLNRFWFEIENFGKPILSTSSRGKSHHVYAMEMSDNTVKIGATGDIEQRKKSLESTFHLDVLNVHTTVSAPRNVVFKVERACHNVFAEKRVRGEFYAIKFKEACAELDRHNEELSKAREIANEKATVYRAFYKKLVERFFSSIQQKKNDGSRIVTDFERGMEIAMLAKLAEDAETRNKLLEKATQLIGLR